MNKKKSKSKVEKLTCSCCKGITYNSNLSKTIGRKIWIWGSIEKLEFDDLKYGEYQWACDECLISGKAIMGNTDLQMYCDFAPYLAYFDIIKLCEKCHLEFSFSKTEQKYWYESLKFWVQSKPKQCPECRRSLREEKKLNNELSAILTDKDKLTIKDMERLSEIYEEIKKPDKSTFYKRLAEKEKNKRPDR